MTIDVKRLPTLRVLQSYGDAVVAAKMGVNHWDARKRNVLPLYGIYFLPLVKEFQTANGIPASGVIGPRTWEALMPHLNAAARALLPQTPKPRQAWENIGPIQPYGVSLLNMSLTHPSIGIPLFPAVDTAWGGGGGVVVIAPEPCVVDTKDTSSSPGEAVYLTGTSTLRYWVGHLDRDWPLGHKFAKGELIGRTLPIPGKSDHAHWGVNAEALIGKGKELRWGDGTGTPYTHGAPTIRRQLEAST